MPDQPAAIQKIKIGVRELIEFVLRSGDLNLEFTAAGRSVEAIFAHQHVQRRRPAAYMPEVTVNHTIETEHLVLEVGGRIDGVWPRTDAAGRTETIIDEIKTSVLALKEFRADTFLERPRPLHWGQVKCYGYLYAARHQLKHVTLQLTYYHLDSGKLRELRQPVTFEELEAFFNDCIQRYLAWAETIAQWRVDRNHAIAGLAFPFAHYRPGQRELAVAVYRCIRDRGQLTAQAATGIGKTAAVLFPAIKALWEGHCTKIFYLTARTTGRTVAEKALDDMHHRGLRLKAVTLTAKDKICFDPQKACTPQECQYAKGHFDRLNPALFEAFEQDALTRSAITALATKHCLCPFEFSLELCNWADTVICDYNYAFDPQAYLRRFFLEDNAFALLVDEAHNLVDRSREMFSAQLSKQAFIDLRRRLKKRLPKLHRQLGRINTQLLALRKTCGGDDAHQITSDLPDKLLAALKRFLRLAEQWLKRNLKTAFREDLLNLFFEVNAFMRVTEILDSTYTVIHQRAKNELTIKLFCLDPSVQLGAATKRCRAAIFFSATMTPAVYFTRVFGCRPDTAHLVIPSPFPTRNFNLSAAHRISTLYKQRAHTKAQIAQYLHTLTAAQPGNYLFFFPSYAYLVMVHEEFTQIAFDGDIILQTPALDEAARDEFLAHFACDRKQSLAGFAVMGGIFGEGIDLVGKRLAGAAIVGVGLPGICVERDLIRDFFNTHEDSGFEYAYLYPGLNRVLQAAGRVIRTDDDIGVVLLIDQRYRTHRYRSLMPGHWQPNFVNDTDQLRNQLTQFWTDAR